MSGPEYVLGLLTIISGLAIGDLVMALHRLLRARWRVVWDVLPLAAAAMATLIVVVSWWLNWDVRADKTFNPTLWWFCLLLIEMVLMFLMACAALPDEAPPGPVDLRAFYASEGRYFWTLFTLLMGFYLLHSVIVTDGPAGDWGAVWTTVAVVGSMSALGAALAVVRSRRVHLVGVAVLLVGTAAYNLGFRLS